MALAGTMLEVNAVANWVKALNRLLPMLVEFAK
jgi:hypothetical protein